MPTVKQLKEKRLKEALANVNSTLSQAEVNALLKAIMDAVKARELKFVAEFKSIKDTIDILKDSLKDSNVKDMSDTISKLETRFSKLHNDQANSLNFIRDKVRNLVDGKDADEEKIVGEVLAQMPELPDEFTHPPVTSHRDELESLKGDERLKLSAIDGLDKRLKELEDRPLGGRGGGGTSAIGVQAALPRIIQTETPAGLINSSNKVYTVTSNIGTIFSFGINGMVIHSDEYSTAGRTITFTTAFDSSLSGTSFEIIYV